mgnify:CR=1 FL=1
MGPSPSPGPLAGVRIALPEAREIAAFSAMLETEGAAAEPAAAPAPATAAPAAVVPPAVTVAATPTAAGAAPAAVPAAAVASAGSPVPEYQSISAWVISRIVTLLLLTRAAEPPACSTATAV